VFELSWLYATFYFLHAALKSRRVDSVGNVEENEKLRS
jgi:hypothetical protein